jgi:hypothetical protein
VTESAEGQIAAYKRLGRVWEEKLGRERNALDAWLAADQIDPRDLETLGALANLYRSTQSWEELSQTLRRIIEVGQITGAATEEELIRLYASWASWRATSWAGSTTRSPPGARSSPSSVQLRGAGALENLFTREARWKCIEVLEKRALVLDDETQRSTPCCRPPRSGRRRSARRRAAAVYERCAEPAIASSRLRPSTQPVQVGAAQRDPARRVEHQQHPERIAILTAVAKNYGEPAIRTPPSSSAGGLPRELRPREHRRAAGPAGHRRQVGGAAGRLHRDGPGPGRQDRPPPVAVGQIGR